MLGWSGEADDDAVAVGDLGQWMAHPRQALQRNTGLTRPSQHFVLASLGQSQQHVHTCGQTADPDVESGERVDEDVAPPSVMRTHPSDVAAAFSERELGQVIAMALTINAWKRIGVTTRLPLPKR